MLLSVNVSACLGSSIVPWSILEVNDEEYTFNELFTGKQASRFESVSVPDDLNPLVDVKQASGARPEVTMHERH